MVAGGPEKTTLTGRAAPRSRRGYSREVWGGWWKCFPEREFRALMSSSGFSGCFRLSSITWTAVGSLE